MKQTNRQIVADQQAKVSREILACLSSPKTFMSQETGQRAFSARSRACGLFQLFYQTIKIDTFTRQ
jgi:hypothetical protein